MTGQAYYNLNGPTDSMGYAQLKQEINVKGATYIFALAEAAIAAYEACVVDNAGNIQGITTTNSGDDVQDVVIPQYALASGEYGWVPAGPFHLREDDATAFKVLAATLCALDVKLYTTATAGVVDDSATDLITGLSLTATNAAGGTVATACIAVSRLGVNRS